MKKRKASNLKTYNHYFLNIPFCFITFVLSNSKIDYYEFYYYFQQYIRG